ncbi:D-glucosaminate-6-phosphate ammonia lyase [subsurface metagenome]
MAVGGIAGAGRFLSYPQPDFGRRDLFDLYVDSSVPIVELNRRVGEYVASVTGAEAGMITCGAAAGIVLATAACMTGTDAGLMSRLPDSAGMKNEIVTQVAHMGGYVHNHTTAGAALVPVGTTTSCSSDKLRHAITPRTAAVAFLIGPGVYQSVLSLPEVAAIAHDEGVPVIVDAAAMVPPRDNFHRIIREGADLVTVSGGKCIRGPQATGLLFGRRDLVEAALLNASPHDRIGRPLKVAREEIIGLATALQLFMETDEEAEFARETETARLIADSLADIPGIRTSVEDADFSCIPPGWYYRLEPYALLRFERNRPGRSPSEVSAALAAGDPPIYAPRDRLTNGIPLNPFNLLDDEVDTLLRRVREELTA